MSDTRVRHPMALQDAHCLALYERGLTRHPIDRALLLAAAAASSGWPGTTPDRDWADAPLGERDARLIALRCDWFGPHFEAVATCPACRERLTLSLNLHALAGSHDPVDPAASADAYAVVASDGTVQISGARFRRPTSRDLAAVVSTPATRGGLGGSHDVNTDEADAVGRALLQRLALDPEPEGGWTDADIAAIEKALDQTDPLAHVTVDAACEACGHHWPAPLDIAASLWDELVAQARGIVQQVHLLASAYGWSEDQILAMPATRRSLYLQQVVA